MSDKNNVSNSLAYEILQMQRVENKRLFIINILEVIALIIALFIIFL